MSVTFGEATSQSVGGAGSTTTSSETMVSVTVNQAVEATDAIAVEIATGASVTGGGAAAISGASDGAGVYIKDGTSASLTVAEGAALSSVRGTAGNALVADGADVTVTNAGTITGSVVNAACEVGGASRRIVSRRRSSSWLRRAVVKREEPVGHERSPVPSTTRAPALATSQEPRCNGTSVPRMMAATSMVHIGQRLLDAYDSLPRGERRLADLLLEDVGVVGHMNAGELAARARVSKATAARLFRRLGYPGYKAAQRELREERAQPTGTIPSLTSPEARAAPSPSSYLDAEVKHLVRTFELIRADTLNEAVRLLRDGEKLWVIGFGEDYPLAHFARAMLIKLRPDIRMIPIGGFPVPEEFASISSADTVLALGVGRRTQALRNVLGSAARSGAKVILVTGTIGAADRSVATVILRSRGSGPTLFDSSTATVSLLTYLCALLAARIGARAVERLHMIEAIHAEWGDSTDPET